MLQSASTGRGAAIFRYASLWELQLVSYGLVRVRATLAIRSYIVFESLQLQDDRALSRVESQSWREFILERLILSRDCGWQRLFTVFVAVIQRPLSISLWIWPLIESRQGGHFHLH